MKLTTHHHLLPGSGMVELYVYFPICLHGIVLKEITHNVYVSDLLAIATLDFFRRLCDTLDTSSYVTCICRILPACGNILCCTVFISYEGVWSSIKGKCDLTERADQCRKPVDLIKNILAFNTEDR
jgi:hypothetical protein